MTIPSCFFFFFLRIKVCFSFFWCVQFIETKPSREFSICPLYRIFGTWHCCLAILKFLNIFCFYSAVTMTKLRKNLTRLDHIGSHFVFLLIINITFITCLSVTSELPNINYNNTDPNAISSPGVCFFVCFVLFCFRSR